MFKIKQCSICGGNVKDITVRHLERWADGLGTVFFEDVPAQQCVKCGEKFFSGEVMEAMESILNKKVPPPDKIKVDMPAYPREAYLK